MSAPGEAVTVSAGALMALEPQAARLRGLKSLSERPGTVPIRKRGRGHEIREIRPFTEGDDPRYVDAAASARTGKPQVRSFQEDRERALLLIADFRRPMLWGTQGRLRSVAAAEALALAGWQAVLDGGVVGAVALTDAGTFAQLPRARHRGMALVAGCLANAHAAAEAAARQGGGSPTLPLAPLLMAAARCAPRGAGIVLASGLDVPGAGLDAALAALTARGPLHIVLTEDAFERAPPDRILSYATAEGPARARFGGLTALRAARAEALVRPGLTVERLASDRGPAR